MAQTATSLPWTATLATRTDSPIDLEPSDDPLDAGGTLLHNPRMGMAEDARRRGRLQAAEQHNYEQTEQHRQAEGEAALNELVQEFLAAARKLGIKPQKRSSGGIFAPRFYRVYLGASSSVSGLYVYIKADGSWDCYGGFYSKRHSPPMPRLDPAKAPKWRRALEDHLADRSAGVNESHAGK